jgi:subtilisin-like proprotein convertase family protein
MRRDLTLFALLLSCIGIGSAQMVWDHAASFAKPAYLAIPSGPGLRFSGNITLECWVNPVDVASPHDQTLLCKYSTAGTGFALTLRDGHIFFEIGGSPKMFGKHAIPNGEWTHVAVVYDSSAKTLTSYINRNLDSVRTGLDAPIRWNEDSLFVGIFQNYPTTTQFTGLIDEIRVWNRALSADEIQRNMYMTLAYVSGPYAGVVLSLPFQYPTEAPLPFAPMDFSGNGMTVNVRGNVLGVNVGTGPSWKLIPNDAVCFDGGGYLSTPGTTANNFSSSHTLQCWVWPDTTQTSIVLQKREGGNLAGYTIWLSGNRVAFRINNPTVLMSRQPIPSGEWTHIAVVFNDTTKTSWLYLNGSLDTTAVSPFGAAPIASNDSLFIGTGYNGRFHGYIDNVVLSPEIWTATQIATWMAAGVDVWNKGDLPAMCVYNFDGSLLSVAVADARMKFNGSALFSHAANFSRVPTSPMLRADDLGYPRGFTMKASDRRIPAVTTQGPMIEDSLDVAVDETISSMRLAMTVNHTMTTDLVVSLVGPTGDSVTVFKRGKLLYPVSNINTIYDDWADSSAAYDKSLSWLPEVKPYDPQMGEFRGKNSKGMWRLRVSDVAGGDVGRLYVWGLQFNNRMATAVTQNAGQALPEQASLSQSYPNPFNASATISYRLQARGNSRVRLDVYDILGRGVAVLVDEMKEPGSYQVKFDGSELPSGVYFYRLTAGDFVQTRKLVLLR